MPGCIPDLSQCAASSQGVADEGVPTVMDGQHAEPLTAQHLACGEEPAAQGVPLKRLPASIRLDRADERVGVPSALGHPFLLATRRVARASPRPTKAELGDCGPWRPRRGYASRRLAIADLRLACCGGVSSGLTAPEPIARRGLSGRLGRRAARAARGSKGERRRAGGYAGNDAELKGRHRESGNASEDW